ncbi:YncE family protein, partial [Mycobacterium tuberculosis]
MPKCGESRAVGVAQHGCCAVASLEARRHSKRGAARMSRAGDDA